MGPLDHTTFSLLLVAVVLGGLAVRALILKRVQHRHASVWSTLGAPPLLDLGFSDAASRRATAYLWTGKWVHTRDPVIVALGLTNWVLAGVVLVLFYHQIKWGF